MREISTAKLHELFVDTVRRATSDRLSENDEDLGYNLFEEFAVGVQSFFHSNSIQRLADAGLIDMHSAELTGRIRAIWAKLDSVEWTMAEVRSVSEWRTLFSLCDELHALVGDKSE